MVVAVDELVLKFTNLVDQDAQLVGNIRDIVIAGFTPEGELLLCPQISLRKSNVVLTPCPTATSIRSLPTSSMLRMTFFSIFTS